MSNKLKLGIVAVVALFAASFIGYQVGQEGDEVITETVTNTETVIDDQAVEDKELCQKALRASLETISLFAQIVQVSDGSLGGSLASLPLVTQAEAKWEEARPLAEECAAL